MKATLDMRKLNSAIAHLQQRKRRGGTPPPLDGLLKEAAKGFVRNIIAITPPARNGVTGPAAKRRGEAKVAAAVLKIAQPVTVVGRSRKGMPTEADILAALARSHKRARATFGSRGRGDQRKPDQLFAAHARVFRVIARLQKNVGWLSAGWNSAAAKLGVPVPRWIRRHGTIRSAIVFSKGARGGLRILLVNAVGFVGNVPDYARRVQFAVDWQASKMSRNAAHALSAELKQAGFK
jgi:hypothetical protein